MDSLEKETNKFGPRSSYHVSKLIIVFISLLSAIGLFLGFIKTHQSNSLQKTELIEELKIFKNESSSPSTDTKEIPEDDQSLKKECPFQEESKQKLDSIKFHFENVFATHELIPKSAKHQRPKNTKLTMTNFVLGKMLGRGTSGIVYKGTCIPSGEPVAIKVYSSKALKAELQYAKEVLYMNLLKNAPFICRLFFWKKLGSEEAKNYFRDSFQRLVLGMELASGGDLSDALHSSAWSDAIVRKWMSQIIVAIQHMHAHGIIHRDLKLENILLTGSGDVRVCDFGYSKRFKTSHNKLSNLLGTLVYIPAEIFLGAHASYKSDIFALGMIFYHFITTNPNIPVMLTRQENDFLSSGNFEQLVILLQDNWNLPVRGDAPAGAAELFRGMVNPDRQKRLNLSQIMQSEYFQGVDWLSLGALEMPLLKPF